MNSNAYASRNAVKMSDATTSKKFSIDDAFKIDGTPVSTVTRINRRLKAAGYGLRLVRGRGYYYLNGDGSGSLPYCSIYSYRLEPTDFAYALGEVNFMLREAGLAEISA